MKIVILSGGNPPSIELLKEELMEASVLICADSGANFLFQYDIVPDYLIGDFDSINPEALKYFYSSKSSVEKYPVEKDDTDTQLALLKAVELNASTIVFLGCTGSRLDHTFGNLGLLLQCINLGIKAYIRDDKNTICLSDKPLEIFGKANEYFSLLAYGSDIDNLTIHGSKYNLNNYRLRLGSSLTISNMFIENKVSISFNSGILMITKSFD
jgi:thiamine pyrophosphokinase